MAKKIIVTDKPSRRIEVTGKPQRRIEPEELASALGAEPVGEAHASSLDALSLTALGSELIKRLRSTGGRPALTDATEICRVPLSADDLKALERITEQIAQSSGMKPSPGQVASTIVREHLTGGCTTRRQSPDSAGSKPLWPEGWNGRRETYRATQEIIEIARSTWGRKDAA